MKEFFGSVLQRIREHKLLSSVGSMGILFLLVGLSSLFSQPQQERSLDFSAAVTPPVESKTLPTMQPAKTKKILVDVSGAVVKPGVYSLDADARIQDALVAAGGIAEKADRARIAQMLNLAAKLSDGAKVYIPRVGETQVTLQGAVKSETDTVSTTSSGNGVNINQASESELDTLPGIGKVTAEKIIANRPYQSINELTQKKVLGASVFEKIKDKITVY